MKAGQNSYLIVVFGLACAAAHDCIHDQLTGSLRDFLATRPDKPQAYALENAPLGRNLASQVASMRFHLDFSRIETSM